MRYRLTLLFCLALAVLLVIAVVQEQPWTVFTGWFSQPEPEKEDNPDPGEQETGGVVREEEKPSLPGKPPVEKKPEEKPDPPPEKSSPENPSNPAPSVTGGQQTNQPQVQPDLYEEEVVALLNGQRRQRSLPALKTGGEISRLARLKSEDMRDKDYFASTSPTYGTASEMLQDSGIRYTTLLEKIAGGVKTPAEVVDFLLKDPQFQQKLFRANYNYVGVGYAYGKGEYYHYWTIWLLEIPGPVDAATRAEYEKEVLRLVNIERKTQGMNPLQWDEELKNAARAKSEDMRDRNYFDHESPTYGSVGEMLDAFGITYRSAGENLAAGQRTPAEVVEGWMNSPGHRENILNPDFTHLGVGYADGGGDYFYYWTQLFVAR